MSETYNKAKKSKTFCLYPWLNLNSNTDGRVKLCCNIMETHCVSGPDGADYIMGYDSIIHDIWNSESLKETRLKMLAGEKVSACEICYRNESSGITSPRQNVNEKWLNEENSWLLKILEKTKSSGELNSLPNSLELRLGNHCNLKCHSCWGVGSSSLRTERNTATQEHYSGKLEIPKWLANSWYHQEGHHNAVSYNWYERENFSSDIDELAWRLSNLYLTGGEPTLIPKNVELLSLLLERGKDDCNVKMTTNLSFWNDELYHKLSQFKQSEVQVSIDGFQGTNSYIRRPLKWEILEENFEKLLALPDTVNIVIYTVVQAMNILCIDKLLNWLEKKSHSRKITWHPIILENPPYLMASVIPQKKRLDYLNQISPLLEKLDEELNLDISHGKKELINCLGQELKYNSPSYYGKEFNSSSANSMLYEYLNFMDQAYNLDHRAHLPELY